MNKYYFTFGSDPLFPYQDAYLVVKARNLQEALGKFRGHYPNRPGSSLANCAFYYDEADAERYVIPHYGEPVEIIE